MAMLEECLELGKIEVEELGVEFDFDIYVYIASNFYLYLFPN